jgi:mono/diheme cytochrome c family protein
MRGNLYQLFLIILAVFVTALFGVFLYRELNPEYMIYQKDYVALEKFRSSYTGEAPPPFKEGIKQIVLTKKNKGPEEIDRCISCHVALKFEHFSPTKIAHDINGQIEYDTNGFPKQIPNENYIWAKLDEQIEALRNPEINKKLESEGRTKTVNDRLAQADAYEALKTANSDGNVYQVKKALSMHPLIGRETRPFELHPMEEYGCVSCHGGNGRGLTTDKAHGPVFDGEYEIEDMGPTPVFLEQDKNNDPQFSRVFNHKPGHALLFQTTPILVGALIESKCVQCHNSSSGEIGQAYHTANQSLQQKKQNLETVTQAYEDEIKALSTLLKLKQSIDSLGYKQALSNLDKQQSNYEISPEEQQRNKTQFLFLKRNENQQEVAKNAIQSKLLELIGSESLLQALAKSPDENSIKTFVSEHPNDESFKGSLFTKAKAVNAAQDALLQIDETKQKLKSIAANQTPLAHLISHIDLLTKNYQRGEQLYISQACYACHRIEGLARGGIGPDLTEEGHKYPWFIKESIVWPQADLKSSTMPNFHLDHEELEDLTTFLLAQTGQRKYESATAHKIAMAQWEAGAKRSWEEPLSPAKMHNLDDAMEIFATEGCASCHRLKGFESNVGFAIEKNKEVDLTALEQERLWFNRLFPEDIAGSQIIETIDSHKEELESKIVNDVRANSLLERLQSKDPESVAQFYSNFKYAFRAKDHELKELAASKTVDPKQIEQAEAAWHNLVQKVMMIYVQEYGLGRLIGPRPNWSGVYRSDKWLMEHFFNPSAVVRRSIMPVMPFDTTKFYALTYMLDALGIRNRNQLRQIWEIDGFNPEKAYQTLCSQCHGEYLEGNGPVSEWIYPIPKNLRSADFLRNLTREKAYESIMHGVNGTPMPPWGEASKDKPTPDNQPVLTQQEIVQIVDWLFSSLPGGSIIQSSQQVPKWQYSPQNVIDELNSEKNQLQSQPQNPDKLSILKISKEVDSYYAALQPKVQINEKEGTSKNKSENRVDDLFDIVPHNSVDPTIKNFYFIKKKYYTKENLKAGQEYFEMNCAVCHGREADGSGNRATAMVEAKPRMLTNLAWLESKDDLRLLRSIKYGVPGTAMVAWGDQTSSLQRLQLVMFIRSLSEDAKIRDDLSSHIYDTFNNTQYTLEEYRISLSPQIVEAERKLHDTESKLNQTQRLVEQNKSSTNEAVTLYQEKLKDEQRLKFLENKDKLIQEIIAEVNREKQLLLDLGLSIITQKQSDLNIDKYHSLIDMEKNHYTISNGVLEFTATDENQFKNVAKTLKIEIEARIQQINQEKIVLGGKISTPSVNDEIQTLNNQENALKTLMNKISTFTEEALRSQKKQQNLVNELNKLTIDTTQTPDAQNASKMAK